MASLPTGTVTFLFADIEGSTRLLQQLGDCYADVLVTHHRLLRNAIEEAQGQVVDTQGDAVFAAFPRVVNGDGMNHTFKFQAGVPTWVGGSPTVNIFSGEVVCFLTPSN